MIEAAALLRTLKPSERGLTDEQIKHMVDRFLGWKLPEKFNPDNGIGFKHPFPDEPMRSRHWPIGTNLFCATQATEMVKHMVEGLPDAEPPSNARITPEWCQKNGRT